MAQALRHHAKHTGVHTKLGESKKGIQRIGISGAELRRMHDRALQNQNMRLKAPLSDAMAEILVQKELEREQAAKEAAREQGQGVSFKP